MTNKLEAIAEMLERTVPDCDSVSIALVVEEAAITGAASSQLAVEADLVQYFHDQGPCLTAIQTQSEVRIDVLRSDERFEHFAPGAIEHDVHSVLSLPLCWAGSVIGSINLYSSQEHAFADATADQVAPFADYAAQVIAHSPLYAASLDLIEGLVATRNDTDDIERALDLLLETGLATRDVAWGVLRQRALSSGVSIPDAARELIGGSRSGERSAGDR